MFKIHTHNSTSVLQLILLFHKYISILIWTSFAYIKVIPCSFSFYRWHGNRDWKWCRSTAQVSSLQRCWRKFIPYSCIKHAMGSLTISTSCRRQAAVATRWKDWGGGMSACCTASIVRWRGEWMAAVYHKFMQISCYFRHWKELL